MVDEDNRFARPLSDEQREIAERSFGFAKATFADFQDDPNSHYYCATDHSPEETWRAVTTEVARVAAIAATDALRGGALEVSDVEAIHRAIFRPVFGHQTLGLRRHEEQVNYGIVLGKRDKPDSKRQDGISARSLPASLRKMMGDLRSAIAARDSALSRSERREVLDATRPAAAAYGRFLAMHPFMDGNGRTAFPLLNFALIRLGLLAVAVPETSGLHWCLGQAMRRSHRDPEPLAVYLRDLIVSSE